MGLRFRKRTMKVHFAESIWAGDGEKPSRGNNGFA
jgi:hypothetical protein